MISSVNVVRARLTPKINYINTLESMLNYYTPHTHMNF